MVVTPVTAVTSDLRARDPLPPFGAIVWRPETGRASRPSFWIWFLHRLANWRDGHVDGPCCSALSALRTQMAQPPCYRVTTRAAITQAYKPPQFVHPCLLRRVEDAFSLFEFCARFEIRLRCADECLFELESGGQDFSDFRLGLHI